MPSSSAAATANPAIDPWDDWESEDYSRGATPPVPPGSSENARLWQIANSSLSFGQPKLQPTTQSNSYGYGSSAVPPPQAYMPSLKILKRPTSAASNSSNTSGSLSAAAQAKTIKDREKAYLEARKKIFGEEASPSISGNTSPAEVEMPLPIKHPGNTKKKTGKQRLLSPNATDTESPLISPRPSTPSNGVIVTREPVNPPSSKGDSGPVKGFQNNRNKKKVVLSPAAMSFVPKGLVPSKVADKNKGSQKGKKSGAITTSFEGEQSAVNTTDTPVLQIGENLENGMKSLAV